MKTKTFVKKYQGRGVEDWTSYMSDSAEQFAKDFKSTVKDIFKDDGIDIVNWSVGHYFMSGFFKKNDKHVYFSRNIERGYPINLESRDAMFGILVRTAKSDKDYTGGRNNFTSIKGLRQTVLTLFDDGR